LRMLKLKVSVVLYSRIGLTAADGSEPLCPIYNFTMLGGFSGD
jgi:hypothetical protein